MKEQVRETLQERAPTVDVENVDHKFKNEWAFELRKGADRAQHGPSYVILVYQALDGDRITVRTSASINDEHRHAIKSATEAERREIIRDIGQITSGTAMMGAPHNEDGQEAPLQFAERYVFYQYIFPESYSDTELTRMIERGTNAVDQTWRVLWYHVHRLE